MHLPLSDEYPSFYQGYISCVKNPEIVPHLLEQRNKTVDMLGRLSAEDADFAYAEGKWTIRAVVAHLIDCERVFSYRALCFARGETQPLPGMDQDDFMAHTRLAHRSWQSFIDEYLAVRQSTYVFYSTLHPDNWASTGTASNGLFTVRALAFITAGHELHHLRILEERYLPLLK